MVYYGLLILTIASLYLYGKRKQEVFAAFPYFLMACVGGFRCNVGVDYNTYVKYYNQILDGITEDLELGYLWLVRFIQLIGGTQQLVFLIMAFATCYFYYRFIRENSDSFMLSTMLYMCLGPFYLSSYNTMRQALAIGIFLYALKYMDKSFIRYAIWVAAASLLHTSAIVMLLLPLANRLGRRYFLYYIVFSISIIALIETGIVEWLIRAATSGYTLYIDHYHQDMDLSYVFFLIINLAALILSTRRRVRMDKKYLNLMLLSSVLITAAYATGKFSMLLTRFISYASPAIIIAAPKLEAVVRQKRVYRMFVYAFCVCYFVYIINTSRKMLPYNTNFDLFHWIQLA